MDASHAPDRRVARKVAMMEQALESDAAFAAYFHPIGSIPSLLPVDELARFTVRLMRTTTGADVALSTASSFRQDLPPGPLTTEALRAALPYDNEIVTATMTGAEVTKLLAYGASLAGSDSLAIVAAPADIAPEALLRVATTDYLARVASAYRPFFTGRDVRPTGKRVRAAVQAALSGPPSSPAR